MNGISHKQAIQLIHRRADGLLTESQGLLLDQHLHSCDSCHAYAMQMDGLSAHLQNEFHRRWDEKSGPSQNVMEHVTSKAKRIPVTNRISSGAKVLGGAIVLILLAVVINFVVSRLQSTSPITNATEIVNNASGAQDRLIAFASEENGNLDIYTMHADGSGLTNLTNNPARDSNPIWSPDGKHIAFESDRDGFTQIYLMDVNGSNVIQLTRDEAHHNLPLNIDGKTNPWSPDGSRILFLQRHPGGETWSLSSINIHGENKVLLGSGQFLSDGISWSPDGKYIWYDLNASSNTTSFVPDPYIVDADGTNLREMKKLMPENEHLDIRYQWSSDGQSVIFTATQSHSARQTIYEFYPATNRLLQKDRVKGLVLDWGDEAYFGIDVEKGDLSFLWQRPDGTKNTFGWGDSCASFNFRRSHAGNIAIGAHCPDKEFRFIWANADGSIVKPLLESATNVTIGRFEDIAWSPDDEYVAFVITSNSTSMYILNVEESLTDPSTPPIGISISNTELYSIPSWQPVP